MLGLLSVSAAPGFLLLHTFDSFLRNQTVVYCCSTFNVVALNGLMKKIDQQGTRSSFHLARYVVGVY